MISIKAKSCSTFQCSRSNSLKDMFLKILPDLDMPLIFLDTKNHCPKFNGLGDMAIVISKAQIPFYLGHPVYSEKIHLLSQGCSQNFSPDSDEKIPQKYHTPLRNAKLL